MKKVLEQLRSRRGPRSSERGQVLILLALLIVPLSFAVGVVAVDASVWTSERRGAQKDADLAALAGIQELLQSGATEEDAENAAIAYLQLNDEAGNGGDDAANIVSVTVDDSCWGDTGRLDAVTVEVDHDSRGFFVDFFNVPVPQPGGRAKACLGSITKPQGLRPFILDIETSPCFTSEGLPKFGQQCVMDFGSQGSSGGSNRGVADIEVSVGQCSNVPGDGDLVSIIEFGAPNAECSTQTGNTCPSPFTNCVVGQTGNVANKTLDGLEALLSHEGACDSAYSVSGDVAGIDDFQEALELVGGGTAPPSPDNIYVPRPCNASGDISPRIITIFAVDEWIGSNNPMPVRYFVVMYVEGCQPKSGPINKKCTKGGNGPPGHAQAVGTIIQAFRTNAGDSGALNDGPKVISLVE
jgi:hypothetical protein